MRNGGYNVISGYSKNLYGNSRVGIMFGLSLYHKKRKYEICTFSGRQSIHAGYPEYIFDFDGQCNRDFVDSLYDDCSRYDVCISYDRRKNEASWSGLLLRPCICSC